MFESDSIISKSDYEDYKISLSDIFKPSRHVFHDSFTRKQTNTRIANNNYNSSIGTNSSKIVNLYPDRLPIKTVNSATSVKNSSQLIRKKSYNLQAQRTIKKNISNDPFWGLFPEAKKLNPQSNKSYIETIKPISIPETFVVQKIIDKIEQQAEAPTASSLYDKIKAKSEKKTADLSELTRLFDKIEKEKTNFSIKLAYDELFENSHHRDHMPTPHTYLNLDSAHKTNDKTIEIEERSSLSGSPDTYQSLEKPSSINIYSDLVSLTRGKKMYTNLPKKRFRTPYEINRYEINHETYIKEALINIEPAYSLDKDNIYEVDKLAHNMESNLNTDSFITKKLNAKKPLHTIGSNRRLSSIKALNFKGNSKLKSVKEFKNCIITDLKIGEGEFSETFQGYRYDNGIPSKIAAKRLKKLKEKGDNILNLISEISVLTQLGAHPNIIEYFGINTFENTIYMIFEYAEKGDLKKQLESCRKNLKLDINSNYLNKMKIAYEIANGMEYISGLEIVHKDLAARNILLDKDFNCKIADFGCCKADFITRRPIRWMAPESISKLIFTTSSDVWSFAIILWEIWTHGMTPYPGMTDDEVISRVNRWYRLYKPPECPDEVYSLMQSCWKEYSKARPRFPYIKKKLKELYENKID